ncbi:hypothetical protein [Gorillibacterium sp. sgz5001074]|uniref:hypothetical protein n=1 Tax=Gorillibacterium sp. sgz5001074 TaxID=3446695 RepID=UPI003F666370
MEKYVGRTVEIVYLAQDGRLSQRLIQVRKVSGALVYAYCMSAKRPRTFRGDHILAVRPVFRRAG